MASGRSVIINFVANDRVSGAVRGIGRSFDQLNDRVKKAAAPAMAAAGAAAGGAFAAGVAGAIQLDSARGKLEAQLGLTKTQSKNVGNVAGKLYASAYGESMEDVQGAITSVIQNMNGMRDASSAALQQTTARAMDVATVMDEEVGGVTKAVAQMMKTGLAKNAQEAFDIITAGTQRGANKAQDLLDTFNEYGVQFRKLGLDGTTAMGLIQQGLQGGARDADIVADSLKEFSIRAIDGSKSTVAGFKDLGLSAGSMAKQIAAGGPTATKALDLVLDKLRGIKDPIKQNEVATALFGTQWEDMGSALLKMDPSKATAALGQVSGAADRAGKALGETTQAKFQAFTRTLQQDMMGALMATVGWMQKHTTVAKVLAVVVGSAVAVYAGYNVALGLMAVKTAAVATATAVWTGIQKAARVATLAWTGVQWLLNAALTANPIGLVVVAVAALVAGVILAYKNSETFRRIVAAAWSGIKAAVAAAWAFIKPVFDLLKWYVTTVLVGAFKLYLAYVRLVWTVVTTVIKAAWAVLRPIFNVIAAVVGKVLAIAFVVLRNYVKIAWIAIQLYIKAAWAVIKIIFEAVKWYIVNVLIRYYKLLWTIIKAVWSGIALAIKVAWNNGIKPIFNLIKWFIVNVIIAYYKLLWSATKTIWSGIKTAIAAAWNSGIKPAFNAIKTGVNAVKTAFSTAVSAIKTIWDRLKGIAKTPVNFVIGLYNRGIVSLVNKIASFAGLKTRLAKIPTLARGGTLDNPAQAGPMMTDGPMAIVGEGRRAFPEFVIPTDPRYRHRAEQLWAAAGSRLGAERKWLTGANALGGEGLAFERGGQIPMLAGGGIIGSFISGLKNFAIGNVERAAKGVLGRLLGKVPGSGIFRDMVAAIPDWIKARILGWIKSKVGSGAGGPGMQRALAWARGQNGKPYIWGGVGPGGYDCSGWISALVNVIKGRSPYSRLFTTHSFGPRGGPAGFVRGRRSGLMVGVTNAGVGHMAGTLLGTNVESSGSYGVRVGGGARGAGDGMFGYRYGLSADTGALSLRPGWNPPTFNGTGRPELLTTASTGVIIEHLELHFADDRNMYQKGQEFVAGIQAYEKRNGSRWRT